jgi:hypothetical protein
MRIAGQLIMYLLHNHTAVRKAYQSNDWPEDPYTNIHVNQNQSRLLSVNYGYNNNNIKWLNSILTTIIITIKVLIYFLGV